MERYTLSDGYEMPKIGLQTFQMKPEEAEAAAASALAAGYRHIDTANICMNERAVGRAIKRSGIDRNEIFVPSKLWPSVCRAGAEAIDATHSRLDTDYLDMLILRQPAGGYVRAWKAMEDAYAQGKIRTLGLSNFSEKQIQKVLASAHVMPQLVTVECHPCHQQRELRSYLKAHSILLEAWYPLGHGDRRLLEKPVFVRLANRYGKTPAQTVLRWHVQMGTSVIPSSTNPAHIVANADIFDFSLSTFEMAEIAALDGKRRYFHQNRMSLLVYRMMRPDFDAQR